MVSYKGYEDLISKVVKFKQEHVFKYWTDLADNEKEALLKELSNVDYELMEKLFNEKDELGQELKFEPAPFIALPETDGEVAEYESAKQKGIDFIKKGKTAALLVAGGQGTRLGFDGPKGMFPVGPVSNKTLFQIHAEKIIKYGEKYGVKIPWLIMTSTINHEQTVNYFKEKSFFGLDEDDIIFFIQNMIPSIDIEGKFILKSKNSISRNPDGHGGTLTALATSGALDELKRLGIEEISYFQVDNPLIKIIDPVFIGFHVANNSHVSSKGVMKIAPEEKVGVLIKFENGKYGIREYSDLSEENQNARDANGQLLYCMGNPAIHIFNVSFIEEITRGKKLTLPYHLAKKKIKSYRQGNVEKIDGLKFEKFIFDALSLTDKNTILETIREDEFAPVKNATGVDSPESAIGLMNNLFKSWLKDKGIQVPGAVKNIEISPLLAVEPEDLPGNVKIPGDENILLEK